MVQVSNLYTYETIQRDKIHLQDDISLQKLTRTSKKIPLLNKAKIANIK